MCYDSYLYQQCKSAHSCMAEADFNTTPLFRVQPCTYKLSYNIKTFNSPLHLLPLFPITVLISYLCESTAAMLFGNNFQWLYFKEGRV